jgi:hypothetical protein
LGRMIDRMLSTLISKVLLGGKIAPRRSI